MNALTFEQLFDQVYFVIPARKGSKGVPLKNRVLISPTVESIPNQLRSRVIVSTDDDWILDFCRAKGLKCHKRCPELANDTADIKAVMVSVAEECKLPKSAIIVMLYVVWPDREFSLIEKGLRHFRAAEVCSLLCATPVESHPYMCFTWADANRAVPVVEHKLYRRQDYPSCFVINHIVSIFKISELKDLNEQLYNQDTFFLPVEKKLNIDELADMQEFLVRQSNQQSASEL